MTALIVLAAWLAASAVVALAVGATVRLRELHESPRNTTHFGAGAVTTRR